MILGRAEATAREAHLGLWSQAKPVPPWDWRHGQGVPVTAEVIGNRNSHLYHAPHCASVGRMKEANKVPFTSSAEAGAKGYRKAGECR